MKTLLRKCAACDQYTMRPNCPKCGKATAMPIPARYSPDDNYAKYRRKLKELAAAQGSGSAGGTGAQVRPE